MNKIYKVIWNKAKNCYVVVSEIAKAHSKGGSTVRRVPHVGTVLITMLMASVLNLGISAPVWADPPDTGANYYGVNASDNPVTPAPDHPTNENGDGAIGAHAIAAGENAVAIGAKSISIGFGVNASDVSSISILPANIPGETIRSIRKFDANGELILNNNKPVYYTPSEWKDTSFTDEMRTTALLNEFNYRRKEGGEASIAIGNETFSLKNDVVIGNSAQALGYDAVVIGRETTGFDNSVALGTLASAATNSIAIGGVAIDNSSAAQATANYSIAIGNQARATQSNATALGIGAKASTENAIAIGLKANNTNNDFNGILLPEIGNTNNSNNTIVREFGSDGKPTGKYYTRDQWRSFDDSTKKNYLGLELNQRLKDRDDPANSYTYRSSISIGESTNALKEQAVSIGSTSIAAGSRSIAVGRKARAIANDSISVGTEALTGAIYATAIGDLSKALGDRSNALGYSAKAQGSDSTAIGSSANAQGDNSNAIGRNANAQGGNSNALGYSAKAQGGSSTAIGYSAIASGADSVAFGTYANAVERDTIAIGHATASDEYSIAIGSKYGNYYTHASGNQSIAVGLGTQTFKANSVAIGNGAKSYGYQSSTVGFHSYSFGDESTVFGHDSTAHGRAASVFGYMSTAGAVTLLKGDKDQNYKDAWSRIRVVKAEKDTEGKMTYTRLGNRSASTDNDGPNEYEIVTTVSGQVVALKRDTAERPQNSDGIVSPDYYKVTELRTVSNLKNETGSTISNPKGYWFVVDTSDDGKIEDINTYGGQTEGGVSFGDYANAVGNKSLSVGRSTIADGNDSAAIGMFANSYGSGSMAYGQYTSTGLVELISGDDIRHTTSLKTPSNKNESAAVYRRLVNGESALLNKLNEYVMNDVMYYETTSGTNTTKTLVPVKMNAKGELVGYWTGGTASSDEDYLNPDNWSAVSVTIKKDNKTATLDTETNRYYTGNSSNKTYLNDTDELNFEVTFTDGTTKILKAQAGSVLLSEGGVAMGAYAHAEGDRSLALGRVSGAYDKNTTAVGLYANAVGEGAMAIGHNATAGAKVTVEEVDVDTHTTSMNLENGSPVSSGGIGGIAIGSYAHAEGDRAISVGRSSGAYDKNSTAIGLYSNAFGEGAMAIGHNATAGAKVTINEDNPDYHTAVMTLQDGTGIRSTMADGTETKGGIAIGSYAHAVGDRAIAFGRVSGAFGDNSTAMGIYSNALGQGAIAIGHGSSAGVKVKVNEGGADDFWTTELETNTTTDNNPVSNGNDGGIAIGSYAHTEGTRALAVGRVAGAYGTNSTVVGLRSNAYGEGAIAFGHGVTAGDVNQKYTEQIEALHNDPTIPYDLDGMDGYAVNPANVVGAVALGSYAEATGRGSLSVGRYSKARSAYSTTLGIRASVLESAENAIAIGREATVDTLFSGRDYGGINSIAMGTLTYVKGQNSIAIGTADMLSGDGKSIVDADDRKATTVTGDKSIAIGMNDTVVGTSSIAIGTGNVVQGDSSGANDTVAETSSIAIGTGNVVQGNSSGAIGDPNTVNGNNSYILGNNSTIGTINSGAGTEGSTGGDTGSDSGDDTEGDTGSTSGGSSASADIPIDNAFITGNNSIVLSEGGLIYGSDAKIEAGAANGLALGNNTIVSVPGAVALGSTSVAKRAAGAGGAGFDPATGTNHVVGEGENNATWISTLGAVSVGGNESVTDANIGTAATETRQITGVAAGTADTDAVNVAQLKLVQASAGGGTLKFGGDNTTPDTYIIRNSGQALDIKGGANQSNLTESNIAVISNGADKLEVKLSDKIQLTNAGDLTIGTDADDERTTVYQKGIKIEPKSGTNSVMFTTEGISAGGQKIENVADGVALTDAVNVGQLKNARTVVTEGANVKVTKSENGSTWADSYKIDVDNLTYKSTSNNTTTTKSVALATGLNFTDGTNTTAEIADDGVVKFHVSNTAIQEAAAATDKYVTGGSASYGTDGASAEGTVTLTRANAEDVTISGLKNTYTTVTKDATAKTVTFSRNDGVPDTVISLSDLGGSSTDYRLVGAGVSYGEAYTVSGDGTLSLNVQDQMNPDRVNQITINGIATPKDVAAATTEVEGGTNVSVATDTTTAADGHTIYTVNADGAKVSKGSEAVTVTGTKDTTTNITDYVVDLSDTTKATLNKVETDGLTFAGDSGTSSKIKLGDTLSVKGEAAGALTSGNIGVEAAGDTLKIKLAKEVKDVDSIQVNKTVKVGDNITMDGEAQNVTIGSLADGGTVINQKGIRIVPASGDDITEFTTENISAGNQQIHKVKAGEAETDAVNVKQLNDTAAAAKSEVKGGANVASVDVDTTTAKDGHTIYTVNVDDLTYKANGKNGKSVSLADGLNFVDGANTTAVVDEDGVVTFNTDDLAYKVGKNDAKTVALSKGLHFVDGVNTTAVLNDDGSIQFDGYKTTVQKKAGEGNMAEVSAATSADGLTTVYDIAVADMHVDSGMVAYGEDGKAAEGSITLTHKDGTETTIRGLKNTYTTVTKDNNTVTFSRNDGVTETISLSDLGATDYRLIPASDGTYKVNSDGTLTLQVKDAMNEKAAAIDVKIEDVATKTQQDINTQNISTNADNIRTNASNIQKNRDDLDAGWNAKVGENTINVNPEHNDLTFAAADEHVTVTAEGRTIKVGVQNLADTDLSNITEDGKTVITNIARDAITVEGEGGIEVTQSTDKSKYTVKTKLSDNLTLREGNIDLANKLKIGNGTDMHTVTIDGEAGEVTGLTNKTLEADGFGTVGRAATEEQLALVNTEAAKHATVVEGDNVKVTTGTNASGGVEYKVSSIRVESGTSDYRTVTDTNNKGKLTFTDTEGDTFDVEVRDTYTTGVTYDATNKKATFTRNDGNSYELSLKDMGATDYRLVKNASSTDGSYKMADDGTVTMVVQDQLNPGNTEQVTISGLTTKADVAAAKAEVKAGTNVSVATDTKTAEDGHTIYTVNADGASASAGSDAVKVTKGTKDTETNITDYAIDLSDATKATLSKVETRGLTFKGDSGSSEEIKLGDTLNVTGGATGTLTEGNIGVEAEGNALKVKLADNINLTKAGSVTIGTAAEGATVISQKGIRIIPATGDAITEFTAENISAGGQQIHKVKAGKADDDAVNVRQLNEAKEEAIGSVKLKFRGDNGDEVVRGNNETLQVVGDGSNITTESEDNKIKVELSKDLNVNSVTAGNTVINNEGVKADKVTVGDTVIEDGKVSVGDTTIEENKITMGDTLITNDSVTTGTVTADEVTAGDTTINNDGVTTNKVTVGDTTMNSDGLTIDGGPSVTKDGIDAGNKKITGVAAGVAGTDAVNVDQLKEATSGLRTVVEGGTNIASVEESTGKDGQSIYTVNADGASVSAGSDAVKVTKGAKDKDTNITDYEVDLSDKTKAALDKAENEGLTFKGDTGTSNKIKLGDTLNIKGGASGALSDGNIGVEGSGDTLNIKLAKDIKDVDTLQVNKSVKVGNTTIEDNKMTMGDTLITNNGVTANTFTAGDTVITNDGVTANKFTAGDTTLNSDGLAIADGPSVTKSGVNAGGQKVTGVAPGEEDTDAANIGQLRELADNAGAAINNVGNEVNRLDSRMKKGLAGAAALAALHPMDFDPDDKLTFAAGVGNYRGQNAAAIGAFYRPDEKVMFSVGGTVGNGENMVNAGVSFALDRVNRVTTSRTAMAHEIVELKKHIAHQDSQIAQLTQLVNKLVGPEQQIQNTSMFPDVPENHWAYAYLEDLQQRGIVEGYPGGRFIGDRAMTRYEFAAMLDRALQKGVQLDARLTKEFEPELGRIYVERIKGQDNDRHKIERVRVSNTDTRTRDVYGTKIS